MSRTKTIFISILIICLSTFVYKAEKSARHLDKFPPEMIDMGNGITYSISTTNTNYFIQTYIDSRTVVIDFFKTKIH